MTKSSISIFVSSILTTVAISSLAFALTFSIPIAAQSTSTIPEVAQGNTDLSTLVTALTAADLVTTLNGAGPFTVFAPTNDAFEALPAGVLTALLRPENKETLRTILLYHVVADEVTASEVVSLTTATTVQGSAVSISVSGSTVTLNNNIRVTQTDIDASNGVVHTINGVLIPASVNVNSLLAADSMTVRSGGFDNSTLIYAIVALAVLAAALSPLMNKQTEFNQVQAR